MMAEQLVQQTSEQPSGLYSVPPMASINPIASERGGEEYNDLQAAREAVALVENTEQIAAWSSALVALAEAESQAGNWIDAEDHIRHAIELRQTSGVAATIPVEWFLTSGKLALRRRDTKLAFWTYETGLEAIRVQEQQGVDIASWARSEARLRLRLAELHLSEQSFSRAGTEAKRAHEVLWAATQLPIDDVGTIEALFRLLIEIGAFQRKVSDPAAAAVTLNTAVDLGRDMVSRSGQTIDKHRALSFSLNRWAEALTETHDFDGALAAYAEALDIRRQLKQMLPTDDAVAKDLSSALRKVARMLHMRGNVESACKALRESIVVDEERAHRLGSADVGLARMLALSYGQLAQWSEPGDDAIELATRGIEIASQLDEVHEAKDLRKQNLLVRAEIFHKMGDIPSAVDDENEAERMSSPPQI